MSRKNTLIAVLVAAVLALGGLGYYFYQRPAGDNAAPAPQAGNAAPAAPAATAKGPLPDPVFVVLDRQAVLRVSKAGQDIARQMQPVVQQAQNSLLAQRAAVDREAQQLQADNSISPADREKRISALETRQQAIQVEAQRKQQQLSETLARANAPISKAVSEIVPAIVKQRGANIVLDRAAIAQAEPAFDITQEVIAQLDARLPTMKVDMNPPLAAK